MRIVRGLFLVMLLGGFSLAQAAEVDNSVEQFTPVSNTRVNTTVTGSAQSWGLSETEWTDYQRLMQGPNGLWYPSLTPPEVLGLNARTREEQQHFAEIVAQQEHDKVARELSFNQAIYVALRRLYSQEPIIKSFDKTPFSPSSKSTTSTTVALSAGDQLVLFEKTQSGVDVGVLPKLLGMLQSHPTVRLDIYLVDQNDEMAIRVWAAMNRIPSEWVVNNRITLNKDHGQFQQVVGPVASLPYLLLIRQGQSRPVSIWNLS